MGNIYLSVEKAWLEKNIEKAVKAYDKEFNENDKEEKGKWCLFDIDTTKDEIRTEGGEIYLGLPSAGDGPYISIRYKLDPEDYIKLTELAIKRMNKAKALFETLD